MCRLDYLATAASTKGGTAPSRRYSFHISQHLKKRRETNIVLLSPGIAICLKCTTESAYRLCAAQALQAMCSATLPHCAAARGLEVVVHHVRSPCTLRFARRSASSLGRNQPLMLTKAVARSRSRSLSWKRS
ncbi:unnamed protein product [Chondrus crispus]|uniref:Uncharacterized protein n=1 Tax=Chondrus crispus TaxID=2769 RepID=R7Q5Q4_CHOCR|nr:unnamed protein product [Chondrus crispus]CDF33862.1 unnamed protein product [Chondrus crispus]|eukprot:XP_005713681.1 unnamed protein product [Chondrus crispus]